jgi:hypothetical protein
MGSINSLTTNYLQSLLNEHTQTASTGSASANSANTLTASSVGQSSSDNSQLSPLAQVLSTLQQLQQSDPTEYQQLTGQIATNLQSAAQTASNDGNPTAANQLNQLATDFSNASKSGQLPNIQDLAQAVGGGHHHHGHHHSEASSSDSSSSSSSTQTASTDASTLFGSGSAANSQGGSLNPLSIILNTFSTAGIGTSSDSSDQAQ